MLDSQTPRSPRRSARGTSQLMLVGVVAMGVLAGPRASAATVPGGSVHLGLLGGYQITSPDADLVSDSSLGIGIGDLPWFGLRLGVGALDPLSFEVSGMVSPVGVKSGVGSGIAFMFLIEAVGHLSIDPISVDFAAGAGANSLVSGSIGRDTDLVLSGGLGVRWVFLEGVLGLRLDARVLFSDAVEAPIAAHALFTLGLDVFLTRPEWSEQEAGLAQPADDTDTDKDGVRDSVDACLDEAGDPALGGCPDEDGDGLADPEDACPGSAGPARFGGCPDTDADGLPDTIDACPSLHGEERFAGCPDGDADGVPDARDACPSLPGTPDRDGCPTPPAEVISEFGRPLTGVAFVGTTADLRPGSGPAIVRIAELLAAYPDLRVEVHAHVHSKQKRPPANDLTEQRAQAVADRLVQLGVDPRRVGSVGHGSVRPIASNRSAAGRERNERVEVHLLEPGLP